MGMAQMGIPDFQKMQNSNSAIPIYLSLNANRNARGKAEDDHGRKKDSGGRPAEGWPPPTVLFFCCAHPLPGVPLTFLFAFQRGVHGKSLLPF